MTARKPCDGTALDYKRHRNHGEEACDASKVAAALARRRYERSRPRTYVYKAGHEWPFVYKGPGTYGPRDIRGRPGDDQRLRSPTPNAPNFDHSVKKRTRLYD